MHPTQRVRAALHKPIGSMGTFAEDSSVVLPMLPETDGVGSGTPSTTTTGPPST
jgi:hypothetical protein